MSEMSFLSELSGSGTAWAWIVFLLFILAMLALDLGVFHRKSHALRFREAFGWSAFWIALGLSFAFVVLHVYENHWFGLGQAADAVDGSMNDGRLAATKFLTAYVVEKSLSVDNIFVIALLFSSFGVPARYQHRVLFWGILGALVLRGAMIGVGAALVDSFHWVLYLFGGFLILTGMKILFLTGKDEKPAHNPILKWACRFLPVSPNLHGQKFIVRAEPEDVGGLPGARRTVGSWMLTPLAVALIAVEMTDLIFAVDSIPAVFAITSDPFLVFTSNVFAILGLRSLYFLLAGLVTKFRYLKPSLALILVLVGGKMLAAHWLKVWLGESFNLILLGCILGILAVGIVASVFAGARTQAEASPQQS